MEHKELKKLNRRDLIDIIYQMKKQEEKMQEEIAALKAELEDRRIRLSSAGSIAEAATSIADIMAQAQKTADLYLHEIACMKEDTEKECARQIANAKETAARILSESEQQCTALIARYQEDFRKCASLWQDITPADSSDK